jgi:uncharacterized repeat protein (TIGR03803 family)
MAVNSRRSTVSPARSSRRRAAALAGIGALVLGGAATALAAPAAADPVLSAPLASGLIAPLHIAVATNGDFYIAEADAENGGTLLEVDRKGGTEVLASAAAGTEIAGVDVYGSGTVVYTATSYAADEVSSDATLVRAKSNNRGNQQADLYTYEYAKNPDQINTYGFTQELPAACAAQLPPPDDGGIPSGPYTGVLDSHAYSVVTAPGGGWYVADAAANAIIFVSQSGKPSTLSVLPPAAPVTVTPELAAENGLPDCVVGAQFISEPVPTDLEIGPDGMLYVTTLSGGIAPGSVYRINPATGTATMLATGLAGATGLAITPAGAIYVTELFANRVDQVVNGAIVPIVSLPNPADVEWSTKYSSLYVSYDVFGPDGKVSTITL